MSSSSVYGGFWPEDIKPTIQSPLAILKPRADELTAITKGILVGQVVTTESNDKKWSCHNLDVLVPALKNFRQRVLTVKHEVNKLYPAYVDAPVLVIAANNPASSDDELVHVLKTILRVDFIKSTLVSLIAAANEAIAESEGQPLHNSPGGEGRQNVRDEGSELEQHPGPKEMGT